MLSSKNQTQQVILKIPPPDWNNGGAKISSILVRGRGGGGGKNRMTSWVNKFKRSISYQCKIIYNLLSPEGEVNRGGYIPRREASRYISTALHWSLRGIVVLVFIKSYGLKNAASISSSETFVKQRTIFLSVRKTVNIKGYSKLWEPIKTRENCCPLIW